MRKTINFLLLCFIGLILWLVLFGVAGCEILKSKRSVNTDSLSVKRTDTIYVTKKDSGSKTDITWFREVLNYLPNGTDTVINNTTVPVNNYYPTQVIREGGTFSREDYLRLVDSMSRSKTDSTSLKQNIETKSKETKVLSFWQIIGLSAGVCLVFLVISKLKWRSPISLK